MNTDVTTQTVKEKIKLQVLPALFIVAGFAFLGTGAFLFFGSPNGSGVLPALIRCPDITPPPLGQPLDGSDKAVKLLQSQQATFDSLYNQWVGTGKKKTSIAKDIQSVAQKRKAALIAALAVSPEAGLAVIQQGDKLAALNQLTTNCAESLVEVSGTIQATVYDFEKSAKIEYRLRTSDEQEYTLYPANQNKPLRSGDKVTVKGWKIDNQFLASATAIAGEPSSIVVDSTASLSPTGDFKVLALRVLFNDSTTTPALTLTDIRNSLFDRTGTTPSTGSANGYYQAVSYGKVSLSGTVATNQNDPSGWFTVDLPSNNCTLYAIAAAAIPLIDPLVDFTQYTNLMIFADIRYDVCGYIGVASVGTVQEDTQDGTVDLGLSVIHKLWATSDNTAHELGHNFGNLHANFLNCGNTTLGPSGCTNIEYGDRFSIMGYSSRGEFFNAPHLEEMNWLTPSNIYNVRSSGVYTIEGLETDNSPGLPGTSGMKAIKIQRNTNDYLYVEYRRSIGWDTNIDWSNLNDSFSTKYNVLQGGLIHVITSGRGAPWLVDAARHGSLYYAAMEVLPEYAITDPLTGTVIEAIAKTATTLTVRVTLGPDFDFAKPTASFVVPLYGQNVAGQATVTVDVDDEYSGIQTVDIIGIWGGANHTLASVTEPTRGKLHDVYQANWNTTQVPNGPATLKVIVKDFLNHSNTITEVVNVANSDAIPPTLTITAPVPGSEITANEVTVETNVNDNVGIHRVEYWVTNFLQQTYLYATAYQPPYSRSIGNYGPTTVTVKAFDYVGNQTTASVNYTLHSLFDQVPPTISVTAPLSGAQINQTSGPITISATTKDDTGAPARPLDILLDGQVIATTNNGTIEFDPDGWHLLFQYSWDVSNVTAGAHTLTAGAWDSGGNYGLSSPITVNIISDTGGGCEDANRNGRIDVGECVPLEIQ